MIRNKWWLGPIALAATIALGGNSARAQVVPFGVVGGGPAPDGVSIGGADSPHSATGVATHLGKYSGDGVFNSISFDPNTGGGTFHGTFTFVAANGDKLACTYGDTGNGAHQAGAYHAYPVNGGKSVVLFVAEFNPIPSQCTGRFKNIVDGSFLMLAETKPFVLTVDPVTGFTPPFDYAWEGLGWLEYKRGR